jgi:hypothetical protein
MDIPNDNLRWPVKKTFWTRHRDALAWGILMLDALATLWIWNSVQTAVYADAHMRFYLRTEEIRTAIVELASPSS